MGAIVRTDRRRATDGGRTLSAIADQLQRDESGPDPSATWTELLAVGLVADDRSPAGIARYAGVTAAEAASALEQARSEGLIADDGSVDARAAAQLVARLSAHQVASIHAAVARRVLGGAPEDLRRGLWHLRAAATAMPTEELVSLAAHAGRFALDVADAEAAQDLLLLALEHDLGRDPRSEAELNLALSQALTLLGDSPGAQARLLRTVLLAERAGDVSIATRAAERFALPADWQAGDARVVGIIERVQRMPGIGEEERTRLLATRAWVEARLPVTLIGDQQVSWIGRPHVARPIAEEALTASATQSAETRLLALLAWRHTHRAPQFLVERRAATTEALAIAERVGADAGQVEAAVMLAVDALESGDRAAHRSALTTAAAVAERSGDPRLLWRALVPAAGITLMEGDVDAAREIAERAFAAGEASRAPGLLASRWTLIGHLATRHHDADAIATSLATAPELLASSPLGRSGFSLLLARTGSGASAAAHSRATLDQLDEESSLLLTLTRLADTVVELADRDLADLVFPLLAPWSGRVVVDANGWWCDGPVDLWLAELALLRESATGEQVADDRVAGAERPAAELARLLDAAEPLAVATGDVRSLDRLRAARARAAGGVQDESATRLKRLGLTAREIEVLRDLTRGATYGRIAKRLSYSVSTVRNDATSIYRKLGVHNRSQAAARACALGMRP